MLQANYMKSTTALKSKRIFFSTVGCNTMQQATKSIPGRI